MSVPEKRCIDYWLDTAAYRFVGDFEGMYRNIDDPWGCVKAADTMQRNMLLTLLFSGGMRYQTIFDVGCGLGAFSARLHSANGGGDVVGFDVSPTAVVKARKAYPQLRFEVFDLRTSEFRGQADLVVMTEVIWYVLPELNDILCRIARVLRPGGLVCIQQCFPSQQNYGIELLKSADEFVTRYLLPAGLEIIYEWRQIMPKEKVLIIVGKRKDDHAGI